MRRWPRFLSWLLTMVGSAMMTLALLSAPTQAAPDTCEPLSSSIFTSDAGGTQNNGNIYSSKANVYLNGGPASSGSGTPYNTLYYQVVTTSGASLSAVRSLTVAEDGSFRVQLIPFDDSPNGEYKVEVSTDPTLARGSCTKSDNFKVEASATPTPTATSTATSTPTPTATSTPEATTTPTPDPVSTSTTTPTTTPVVTEPTSTPTPSDRDVTSPSTPTSTPVTSTSPTQTPAPTETPAPLATSTRVARTTQPTSTPVVAAITTPISTPTASARVTGSVQIPTAITMPTIVVVNSEPQAVTATQPPAPTATVTGNPTSSPLVAVQAAPTMPTETRTPLAMPRAGDGGERSAPMATWAAAGIGVILLLLGTALRWRASPRR